MGRLNSAGDKYFLHVSMNKIVYHITIAVVLQAVEFWPHKVTIIELRIALILFWWRKITRAVGHKATADRLL